MKTTTTSILMLTAALVTSRAFAQCSAPNLVEQRFPLTGPEQTRWRICWQAQAKNGLIITSAFFRTAPTAPWIRILWDARISEIFVPYHDGSPRYYDVTNFSFNLVPVGPADCPASMGGAQFGNVCKEVRDRGLAWKDYGSVKRGQELVLWGALGAGNYNYVMEWTFRDDGIFMGRAGATAVNLPSKPLMTHVHNPIWRLDIDLDGFPGDTAALGVHAESGLNGVDTKPAIAAATGIQWNPVQFNYVDVSDANLKNAKGHKSSYMLMPLIFGTSRHQEDFTKNEFWVTRYNPSQMNARDLPAYVASQVGQNITNSDIVVWYKGNLHHQPRDEDGEFVGNIWKGEAHVMWTGFMLMPHDLFDRTPFVP